MLHRADPYLKSTETGKMCTSKLVLKIPMFRNFSCKECGSEVLCNHVYADHVRCIDSRFFGYCGRCYIQQSDPEGNKNCKSEVMEGIPMSEPLEASGVFPPMVTHMIKIGEETGTTESMLDKVAEYYEAEVEEATKNLTTIMEPMVIILLAVLVGGILGAVLMPMLGIYENAGNA